MNTEIHSLYLVILTLQTKKKNKNYLQCFNRLGLATKIRDKHIILYPLNLLTLSSLLL